MKTFIFTLLIVCGLDSFAQELFHHVDPTQDPHAFFGSEEEFSSASDRNAHRQSGYLLEANARWDDANALDTFSPNDSIYYIYSSNQILTQAIQYQWDVDSASYFPASLSTYTYHQDTTWILRQDWDADSNMWINSSRTTTKSTASDLPLSILTETWMDNSSSWEPSTLWTYARDAQERETFFMIQNWDAGTGSWIGQQRTTRIWSPHAITYLTKVVQIHTEEFDSATMAWNTRWKLCNTFNAAGHLIVRESTYYSGGTPTTSIRYSYTYNSQDRPSEQLQERFDFDTQSWNNYWQTTYSYQDTGFFDYDTVIIFQWDSNLNAWLNSNRYAYHNTSPNSQEIWEELGNGGFDWRLFRRTIQVYDPSHDKLVSRLIQEDLSGNWVNDELWEWTYNTNDDLTLFERSFWDTNLSQWSFEFRDRYHYVPMVLGTKPTLSIPLKLYPNPASEYLFLDLELENTSDIKLDIRSVEGQLIRSISHDMLATGEQSFQVRVSDLPTGIYLLTIQLDDQMLTRKWVKE